MNLKKDVLFFNKNFFIKNKFKNLLFSIICILLFYNFILIKIKINICIINKYNLNNYNLNNLI